MRLGKDGLLRTGSIASIDYCNSFFHRYFYFQFVIEVCKGFAFCVKFGCFRFHKLKMTGVDIDLRIEYQERSSIKCFKGTAVLPVRGREKNGYRGRAPA